MTNDDKLKKRGAFFNKLPVKDWHSIIAFEQIIKNYLLMIKLLKENEKTN